MAEGSGGPPEQSGGPTDPAENGARGRWWNDVTKVILSLGALAAAISAIVSLWPSPDTEDAARFLSVRVASQVPLSEYRQRIVSFAPPVAGGPESAARTSPPLPAPTALAPQTSTVTPTPRNDTRASSSPDPDDSADVTDTPSAAPESVTSLALPSDVRREAVVAAAEQVLLRVQARLPDWDLGCIDARPECQAGVVDESPGGPSPAPAPQHLIGGGGLDHLLVRASATDADGTAVTREVAVQRLVELLGQTRTVEQPSGQVEPLGVLVSADVELAGLRGRSVLLSWSIWDQGGATPLFGEWLRTNPAYLLEATSERDTRSLHVWIPLPQAPGPYFIRLALSADGTDLAGFDTDPFR